ncbi:MAG: hypothetical protein HYX52_06100 [Chloroflexi bacterium]|nr:hypothetical protein [Chloroflexota bacterium]
MQATEITRSLRRVGELLLEQGLRGEILLLGGAYMSLVLHAREATKDVDAYFAAEPAAIREAATRVAREHGLNPAWLNDAVKGFLYTTPPIEFWAEFPGLRIYVPPPSYVFALKALAGRPEDLRDLQVLRRVSGLRSASEALELVRTFVPERLLTARIQYLVEDLFDGESA